MIPKIVHSRSQVFTYFHDFDDGACVFGMSKDTYPQLFELAHSNIVAKARHGWKDNKKGTCKYLWFPPDSLDDDDVEAIDEWRQKFGTYVLLGTNKHIQNHFVGELDFCMALDYNFDPSMEKRTLYGEAEYQLKYQRSLPHLATLKAALITAIADLPIPSECRDSMAISHVPADPSRPSVPRSLAEKVAAGLDIEFVRANLHCPKPAMKGLSVEAKIPEWQKVYGMEGCVTLQGNVEGRDVVVVDDLYQSGATIWCFGKFLKEAGASHVYGLPCVKSLRDSDNQ